MPLRSLCSEALDRGCVKTQQALDSVKTGLSDCSVRAFLGQGNGEKTPEFHVQSSFYTASTQCRRSLTNKLTGAAARRAKGTKSCQ